MCYLYILIDSKKLYYKKLQLSDEIKTSKKKRIQFNKLSIDVRSARSKYWRNNLNHAYTINRIILLIVNCIILSFSNLTTKTQSFLLIINSPNIKKTKNIEKQSYRNISYIYVHTQKIFLRSIKLTKTNKIPRIAC